MPLICTQFIKCIHALPLEAFSDCLSFCFFYPFIGLCIRLYFLLPFRLSLSVCLSVCLSACLPNHWLSVSHVCFLINLSNFCLSLCLWLSAWIFLSVRPSICQFVRLSVYLKNTNFCRKSKFRNKLTFFGYFFRTDVNWTEGQILLTISSDFFFWR